MKKRATWKLFTGAALASLALGVLLSGPTAEAGIVGSVHDLQGKLTGGAVNDTNLTPDATGLAADAEICVPCHTPHGGTTDAPLWNHTATGLGFTLYTSNSLDATLAQPSGISLLCLSCHDGTVNVDAFGGNTGTTLIGAINGGAADFGKDLTNDHPISFTYDNALFLADGELFDPAVKTTGLGGTIATDMLFAGQMECASCHDVHDNTGETYLLRKSNADSGLCLTCHDK